MSRPWVEDRARLAWWALGVALAAVVAYTVNAYLGTFVFGLFIYYATRPVYRRLRRRVGHPSLAAAIALFALALPVLLLMVYALGIAIQEYDRLPEEYKVGAIQSYVQPYLDVSDVPRTPDELLAGDGLAQIGDLLGAATDYLGFLGTGALHLFVMVVIAFYLLRDGHRLSRWFHRRFDDEGGVLEAYASAVDRSFHMIFFGNILNAFMTGVIGAVAYNAINLFAPAGAAIPYPTLIGLLAGAASLVPVIGMKLVYFPVAGYLAAVGLLDGRPGLLWLTAAFVVVSFVVVDTIPDLVLRPYVSGRDLHVGMVMLAYIFGPLLFGWYGIFLGPMLLVLVVHFTRLVLPELVSGVSIQPVAVDPSQMIEAPAPEASPVEDGPVDAGDAAGRGTGSIDWVAGPRSDETPE